MQATGMGVVGRGSLDVIVGFVALIHQCTGNESKNGYTYPNLKEVNLYPRYARQITKPEEWNPVTENLGRRVKCEIDR